MKKNFRAENCDEVLIFKVTPPLYLPFYNECIKNAYYFYKSFDFDPFDIWAYSTSGSPVILTEGLFIGFLNEKGGRFSFDGKNKLTVKVPKGQEVYFTEGENLISSWKEYNEIVRERFNEKNEYKPETFWSELEYCTWVEQKHFSAVNELPSPQDALSESFVYDYMKRVDALGLPKGKLTIDDGWDMKRDANGKRIYGDWEYNSGKFPHFERMVRDIIDDGFIPGLWVAPFTATATSKLITEHPGLLGHTWSFDPIAEKERGLHYIIDDDLLDDYYKKIFYPYIEMGFKKFKLDFSYGSKREMKKLLMRAYRIIKKKDKSVEVEAHIPDIFVSRYCDTVRINDILLDSAGEWRGATIEHYRVCKYSSEKILNLDHIGANNPCPCEEDFKAHTELLLSLNGGYPSVSLLPDNFSREFCEFYVNLVKNNTKHLH